MQPWRCSLVHVLALLLLCSGCFAFVSRPSPNALHSSSLRLASLLRLQLRPLSPRASRLLPHHAQPLDRTARCYAAASSKTAAARSRRRTGAKAAVGVSNENEERKATLRAANELAFLRSLFEAAAVQGRMSREAYFGGKDVRFLFAEKLIDEETLRELWDAVTENTSSTYIGFEQYLALQCAIDELVDFPDDLPEAYKTMRLPDYTALRQHSPAEVNLPGVYDNEMREFLKTQFVALSGGKSLLSFEQFAHWKPVLGSCLRLGISLDSIREMWADHVPQQSKKSGELDEDGFIAFNARLDKLLDDFRQHVVAAMEKEESESSVEQKQQVYEQWYTELTQGARLLSFDDLVSSRRISDRIQAGILSVDRLRELFNSLPHEAGDSATDVGIARDSFVRLMLTLEAEMRDSYRTLRVERPPVQAVVENEDGGSGQNEAADLASLGSGQHEDHPSTAVESEAQMAPTDIVALQNAVLDLASTRGSVFLVDDSANERAFLRRIGAHIFNLTSSAEWKSRNATSVASLLAGDWQLMFTSIPGLCARGGVSAFSETLPTARFAELTESVSLPTEGARSGTVKLVETLSLVTGTIAVAIAGKWDLLEVPLPTGSAPRITQRTRFDRLTLGNFESELDEQQQAALQSLERMDVAFVGEKLKVLRERSASGPIMLFRKLGAK